MCVFILLSIKGSSALSLCLETTVHSTPNPFVHTVDVFSD